MYSLPEAGLEVSGTGAPPTPTSSPMTRGGHFTQNARQEHMFCVIKVRLPDAVAATVRVIGFATGDKTSQLVTCGLTTNQDSSK